MYDKNILEKYQPIPVQRPLPYKTMEKKEGLQKNLQA